ncbi:MAG: filamentous hemagglutinin N-terminal domain-containing protein [Candidatus Pacebacteria bacterium]|nr:filamentous hemagglutinin N-terminal domain-containing protein [Candidatus Paceibacterota bacterium]
MPELKLSALCLSRPINLRHLVVTVAAAAVLVFTPIGKLRAAPIGGTVAAGVASISASGTVTTITQTSDRAVIDWQGFDLAANETANFVVPTNSGATLNRITGPAPSTISGTITSNGAVYFTNPNGLVFDATSQVTANGFTASTGVIAAAGFMNRVDGSNSLGTGAVRLDGTITAPKITALGGTVTVGGTIDSARGEVLVSSTTLTTIGASAVISVDAAQNGNGGRAIIWSDNHTDFYGFISARGGSDSGNGGFVEVSGKQTLNFDGRVTTVAPHGKTGTLLLDPTDIVIAATVGSDATKSYITTANLVAALNNNDVSIDSTATPTNFGGVSNSTGSGTGGTITISSVIDASANANIHSLSLTGSSIEITANMNIKGDLNLRQYGTTAGAGIAISSSTVRSNGSATLNQEGTAGGHGIRLMNSSLIANGNVKVQQEFGSSTWEAIVLENSTVTSNKGDVSLFADANDNIGFFITVGTGGSVNINAGGSNHWVQIKTNNQGLILVNSDSFNITGGKLRLDLGTATFNSVINATGATPATHYSLNATGMEVFYTGATTGNSAQIAVGSGSFTFVTDRRTVTGDTRLDNNTTASTASIGWGSGFNFSGAGTTVGGVTSFSAGGLTVTTTGGLTNVQNMGVVYGGTVIAQPNTKGTALTGDVRTLRYIEGTGVQVGEAGSTNPLADANTSFSFTGNLTLVSNGGGRNVEFNWYTGVGVHNSLTTVGSITLRSLSDVTSGGYAMGVDAKNLNSGGDIYIYQNGTITSGANDWIGSRGIGVTKMTAQGKISIVQLGTIICDGCSTPSTQQQGVHLEDVINGDSLSVVTKNNNLIMNGSGNIKNLAIDLGTNKLTRYFNTGPDALFNNPGVNIRYTGAAPVNAGFEIGSSGTFTLISSGTSQTPTLPTPVSLSTMGVTRDSVAASGSSGVGYQYIGTSPLLISGYSGSTASYFSSATGIEVSGANSFTGGLTLDATSGGISFNGSVAVGAGKALILNTNGDDLTVTGASTVTGGTQVNLNLGAGKFLAGANSLTVNGLDVFYTGAVASNTGTIAVGSGSFINLTDRSNVTTAVTLDNSTLASDATKGWSVMSFTPNAARTSYSGGGMTITTSGASALVGNGVKFGGTVDIQGVTTTSAVGKLSYIEGTGISVSTAASAFAGSLTLVASGSGHGFISTTLRTGILVDQVSLTTAKSLTLIQSGNVLRQAGEDEAISILINGATVTSQAGDITIQQTASASSHHMINIQDSRLVAHGGNILVKQAGIITDPTDGGIILSGGAASSLTVDDSKRTITLRTSGYDLVLIRGDNSSFNNGKVRIDLGSGKINSKSYNGTNWVDAATPYQLMASGLDVFYTGATTGNNAKIDVGSGSFTFVADKTATTSAVTLNNGTSLADLGLSGVSFGGSTPPGTRTLGGLTITGSNDAVIQGLGVVYGGTVDIQGITNGAVKDLNYIEGTGISVSTTASAFAGNLTLVSTGATTPTAFGIWVTTNLTVGDTVANTGNLNLIQNGVVTTHGIFFNSLTAMVGGDLTVTMNGHAKNQFGILIDNSTVSTGGAMTLTQSGSAEINGIYVVNSTLTTTSGKMNLTQSGSVRWHGIVAISSTLMAATDLSLIQSGTVGVGFSGIWLASQAGSGVGKAMTFTAGANSFVTLKTNNNVLSLNNVDNFVVTAGRVRIDSGTGVMISWDNVSGTALSAGNGYTLKASGLDVFYTGATTGNNAKFDVGSGSFVNLTDRSNITTAVTLDNSTQASDATKGWSVMGFTPNAARTRYSGGGLTITTAGPSALVGNGVKFGGTVDIQGATLSTPAVGSQPAIVGNDLGRLSYIEAAGISVTTNPSTFSGSLTLVSNGAGILNASTGINIGIDIETNLTAGVTGDGTSNLTLIQSGNGAKIGIYVGSYNTITAGGGMNFTQSGRTINEGIYLDGGALGTTSGAIIMTQTGRAGGDSIFIRGSITTTSGNLILTQAGIAGRNGLYIFEGGLITTSGNMILTQSGTSWGDGLGLSSATLTTTSGNINLVQTGTAATGSTAANPTYAMFFYSAGHDEGNGVALNVGANGWVTIKSNNGTLNLNNSDDFKVTGGKLRIDLGSGIINSAGRLVPSDGYSIDASLTHVYYTGAATGHNATIKANSFTVVTTATGAQTLVTAAAGNATKPAGLTVTDGAGTALRTFGHGYATDGVLTINATTSAGYTYLEGSSISGTAAAALGSKITGQVGKEIYARAAVAAIFGYYSGTNAPTSGVNGVTNWLRFRTFNNSDTTANYVFYGITAAETTNLVTVNTSGSVTFDGDSAFGKGITLKSSGVILKSNTSIAGGDVRLDLGTTGVFNGGTKTLTANGQQVFFTGAASGNTGTIAVGSGSFVNLTDRSTNLNSINLDATVLASDPNIGWSSTNFTPNATYRSYTSGLGLTITTSGPSSLVGNGVKYGGAVFLGNFAASDDVGKLNYIEGLGFIAGNVSFSSGANPRFMRSITLVSNGAATPANSRDSSGFSIIYTTITAGTVNDGTSNLTLIQNGPPSNYGMFYFASSLIAGGNLSLYQNSQTPTMAGIYIYSNGLRNAAQAVNFTAGQTNILTIDARNLLLDGTARTGEPIGFLNGLVTINLHGGNISHSWGSSDTLFATGLTVNFIGTPPATIPLDIGATGSFNLIDRGDSQTPTTPRPADLNRLGIKRNGTAAAVGSMSGVGYQYVGESPFVIDGALPLWQGSSTTYLSASSFVIKNAPSFTGGLTLDTTSGGIELARDGSVAVGSGSRVRFNTGGGDLTLAGNFTFYQGSELTINLGTGKVNGAGGTLTAIGQQVFFTGAVTGNSGTIAVGSGSFINLTDRSSNTSAVTLDNSTLANDATKGWSVMGFTANDARTSYSGGGMTITTSGASALVGNGVKFGGTVDIRGAAVATPAVGSQPAIAGNDLGLLSYIEAAGISVTTTASNFAASLKLLANGAGVNVGTNTAGIYVNRSLSATNNLSLEQKGITTGSAIMIDGNASAVVTISAGGSLYLNQLQTARVGHNGIYLYYANLTAGGIILTQKGSTGADGINAYHSTLSSRGALSLMQWGNSVGSGINVASSDLSAAGNLNLRLLGSASNYGIIVGFSSLSAGGDLLLEQVGLVGSGKDGIALYSQLGSGVGFADTFTAGANGFVWIKTADKNLSLNNADNFLVTSGRLRIDLGTGALTGGLGLNADGRDVYYTGRADGNSATIKAGSFTVVNTAIGDHRLAAAVAAVVPIGLTVTNGAGGRLSTIGTGFATRAEEAISDGLLTIDTNTSVGYSYLEGKSITGSSADGFGSKITSPFAWQIYLRAAVAVVAPPPVPTPPAPTPPPVVVIEPAPTPLPIPIPAATPVSVEVFIETSTPESPKFSFNSGGGGGINFGGGANAPLFTVDNSPRATARPELANKNMYDSKLRAVMNPLQPSGDKDPQNEDAADSYLIPLSANVSFWGE